MTWRLLAANTESLAARFGQRLGIHVDSQRLGEVVTGAGFFLDHDPETVRAPDAAFIVKAKLPGRWPKGYIDAIPDLVMEVVSPNDKASMVQAKVEQWLDVGVRLPWGAYLGHGHRGRISLSERCQPPQRR